MVVRGICILFSIFFSAYSADIFEKLVTGGNTKSLNMFILNLEGIWKKLQRLRFDSDAKDSIASTVFLHHRSGSGYNLCGVSVHLLLESLWVSSGFFNILEPWELVNWL